ncbi:MAG: MFS transporter [Nitriliruptor sp.]|uniref:MFS transporter n=1 Tax=Nitriliruptor sp. TaxID=2448056 RepID=UPI0034A0912C
MPTDARGLPVRATVVLGVVTIVGFGVWFYGYGVLLEPIRTDTGWPEATLSSAYGLSLFGAGLLATLAGRLLHRHGSRRVYAVGAVLALGAYLVAAAADGGWVFAVAAVAAGSVTGALGYYAAVHTVIAQLVSADARAGAITTNTLWGAFASPIFLPLVAWVVLGLGWRPTLRLIGVVVALTFLLAAVAVPDGRGPDESQPPLRRVLAAARRDRTVVALLATTFASGVVTSLLILYQVPVMMGAGLTLALASGLAGARGFLQLAGRIPMPWLVRRLGSRTTLRLSHLLVGASCLVLPFAGELGMAVLFAVVAGVGIGALVPAESIFSADALPGSSLGIVLGLSSVTRGVGAAIGPVVGGALTTLSGTRTPALLIIAVLAVIAAALVPMARPERVSTSS